LLTKHCKNAHAFAGVVLVSLALFSATTAAQVPSNAESEQRSQAESRRQQQREQDQRQRQEAGADVRLDKGATPTTARLPRDESPCFRIDQIELLGNDLQRFDWLPAALAGPQGDDSPLASRSGICLGTQGISLVLQRAQNAMVARGFITSRVAVTTQDLSGGKLSLSVLPGRIHAVRFVPVEGSSTFPTPAQHAFLLQSGDILNLREVEQALENFKRVPSADADIQIEPAPSAAAPNQSDLVIRYRQGTPVRVSASLDDSGSASTGKYQASTTLSWDNPLGLNDLFYATLNHDAGGGDTNARGAVGGTQGGTVHYSLPVGYWTAGATASRSRYYQNVVGTNQDYTYRGTSETIEVKLSRIVWRNAVGKTTASLKGFQRRSNNFIDDTEVMVQRRVVGGWELGAGHKLFLGAATLEGNLAYKRGTTDFDAIAAPEELTGEGTARFSLWVADANLALPFAWASQQWRFNTSLRVQDNQTPLTPQDRFAIGSRYTVRGFDGVNSLSAERGWLVRNDLGLALGQSGQEIYFALDCGSVDGPSAALLAGKQLTGAALGLRGGFKHLQYDLFVGAPVDKPTGFRTASETAGFSLTLNF
jgi:hemolysin activation/secretion protein